MNTDYGRRTTDHELITATNCGLSSFPGGENNVVYPNKKLEEWRQLIKATRWRS
ncbi:hypothetical protein [Ferruginibacter sp.]